ncbi:hypothetical protein QYE76_065561 [Lolium multiflorum]|uniref:CCHC-type domain-containing protein n=1 Tax=Lolium multiflorum TaxID=4521 RepID=A0AAD8SAC0_LOLMU|nr:hypothetical protein QYE76_065561 [Lolium multiflorum]
MGSRVTLSDSDLSAGSVSSRAPPPPLRSLVVVPAGHQLGSRGWDAGAGPSRPRREQGEEAPGRDGRPWQISESRRARNARRGAERDREARRPRPAARPPGGNASRIPAALHGCCYNCGRPGHISATCTNDTVCVRCGGTEHTSRDCKRPRSSPEVSPSRPAPPLRRAAGVAPPRALAVQPRAASRAQGALPRPLEEQPRHGAVPPRARGALQHGQAGTALASEAVRTWRDVVSSSSGTAAADGGASSAVGFSAPFAPESPSATPPAPASPASERLDLCYLRPSHGMLQLEADLGRAVMVTVVGPRVEVTPEVAAAEIRAQLNLPPNAFSVHAFEAADFLLLCESMEVRDWLLHAESIGCPQFSLLFEPWSRQVGAVLREAPFLADVEVYGIPGHAWEERTVTALLDGCGTIDEVDPETASRRDMSCFRASVWTHDVAAIPAVRWLAVPEPGAGRQLQVSTSRPRSSSPKMLWYKVRFWVVRWLVGEVPSSGESGGGAAPGGSGSEPGGRAVDDAAPPAGRAARRRRRRAHRRRRARHAAEDGDAGSTAPQAPEELPPVAVDASGRWLAGRSPAAGLSASRADASPPALGSMGAGADLVTHASACGHGSWSSREDPERPAAALAPSPRTCSPVDGSALDGSCSCQRMLLAPSCRATPVGSPCLRADATALAAAEAFLSGQRSPVPPSSVSPGLPCCGHDVAWAGHESAGQAPRSPVSEGGLAGTPGLAGTSSPVQRCPPVITADAEDAAHLVHAHAAGDPPLTAHAAAQIEPSMPAVGSAADEAVTLSALLRQFRLRLEDPLLRLPDPKVVRRRLFHVPSASARRSRRLAAKCNSGVSSPAIKRAQLILMKKLGLSADEERLSQRQLQEYAAIFASPLGPEQVRAIAALFGLNAPETTEDAAVTTVEVAEAA